MLVGSSSFVSSALMRNATCTKTFTKTSLQTDVDPYMTVHVNLMVKLFKTN